ncbi:vitamin K epoxide reductase family protein [Paucihalobacter sp.]|uniref:vitamin K epoxide reductase family protein n=1 Tax=Paucihalobacter sp. TaxID=2850405 RepID=UPI003D1605D1
MRSEALGFNLIEKENINIQHDKSPHSCTRNIGNDVNSFKSHPDYPSLLSFSDALNFFKIKNYVIKVEGFNLDEFPKKFIAVLKDYKTGIPRLSFINIIKDKILIDGRKTTINQLIKDWTGIILLTEEKEELEIIENKTKNTKNKLIILVLFLILFAFLLITNSTPITAYLFLILGLFGFFVSIEIFKNILGVNSSVSQKFCGANKNTNCSSIINSEKWKLANTISLSDLAIVFFSGQLTSLFFLTSFNEESTFFFLYYWGLWLTIPISLISLYIQWKIEKKWCPLCLTIIFILYTQLVVVQFYPVSLSYSITGLMLCIGINLFVIFCWSLLKNSIMELFDLKKNKLKNLRFRKNYQLFKNTLKAETLLINDSGRGSFVCGNPKANLKIFMSTNPFCGYCKNAHKLIENILDRYSGEIVIFMRFTLDPEFEKRDERLYLHRTLTQHYLNNGYEAFLIALKYWFEEKDLGKWKKSFDLDIQTEEVDDFLKNQFNWCENNKMYLTPSLAINDKKYPDIYNNEDLFYFINDLLFDYENTH